jgi:hypothetical protein
MPVIENITLAEIQEYYPVTDSLSQLKIDTVMKHVKNVTFLEMFGFDLSTRIFDGTIADSASAEFMGFRKFVAMCIARQQVEETYVHTNAGLKAVNQPNWSSPTVMTKNTTLMQLNNAVEAQFVEAKKILKTDGETPTNNYAPYSSFEIHKI